MAAKLRLKPAADIFRDLLDGQREGIPLFLLPDPAKTTRVAADVGDEETPRSIELIATFLLIRSLAASEKRGKESAR